MGNTLKGFSVLVKGHGFTANKLAGILGVTQPTANEKLKRPEKFTLGDVVKIARYGHIPIDDLREAIKV